MPRKKPPTPPPQAEPPAAPAAPADAPRARKTVYRKTKGRHTGKPRTVGPRGQGRPTFEPTEEQRRLVTVMVAGGIQHQLIAEALTIGRPTLEKHFKAELRTGAMRANAQVVAHLFAQTKLNVRACEFWLTNRASERWAHKQKIDGNIDLNVQLADRIARAKKRLKDGDD